MPHGFGSLAYDNQSYYSHQVEPIGIANQFTAEKLRTSGQLAASNFQGSSNPLNSQDGASTKKQASGYGQSS